MFKHLSLPERFAVLGAVLFVLVGSLLTYLDYRTAVERMDALARNANTVAVHTLWSHIGDVALPLLDHGPRGPIVNGSSPLLIDEIERRASDILRSTDVDKIVIFNADGRILYSTDRAQIGSSDSNNPRLLRALRNEEVTEIERFDRIVTIKGIQHDRAMNATYMPIYAPGEEPRPIGVFEIYTDVTDIQKTNRVRAWIRLGMLLGGMAFVFVTLSFLGPNERRSHLINAAVAVVTIGCMWLLFTYALGVILPQGEILPR